jgi:hypothetical protein
MVALDIVRSTFDDILADLWTSLKISFPFLLVLGTVVAAGIGVTAFGFATGTETGAVLADGTQMYDLGSGSVELIVALLVVGLPLLCFGFCSTAVAWHRYVMLAERPTGWLPVWHGGLTWSYFWASFLLFILCAVVLVLPTAALGSWLDTYPDGSVFLDPFGLPDPLTLKNFAVALIFSFLAGGFVLRMSVVLPALAVGQRLRFGEAWKRTSATEGDILFGLVSVIMMLAFGAMDFVTALVPDLGLMALMTLWIQIIVGIGIVTRLYMHVVRAEASGSDPPIA